MRVCKGGARLSLVSFFGVSRVRVRVRIRWRPHCADLWEYRDVGEIV